MKLQHRRYYLIGTVIDISLYHDQAEPLLDQAQELLEKYRKVFSANDDDSDLMAINHAAGQHAVPVTPELYQLIAFGKKHSCAKNSQLNIAIGPLVQTWRIGFKEARPPDPDEIAQLLPLCQPDKISLDEQNQTIYLSQKGMKLDLGAIAKGYIADQLCHFFKAHHVTSGFINLGGNVLTFGPALHHADELWRVGIRQPRKHSQQNALVLAVRDKAVVTSGIYERTLTHQGKTYHHLLDRRTGYPMISDMASLTILTDSALDADTWSSRLFGNSPATILAELVDKPELEAFVISKNNTLHATPNVDKRILFLNPQITYEKSCPKSDEKTCQQTHLLIE